MIGAVICDLPIVSDGQLGIRPQCYGQPQIQLEGVIESSDALNAERIAVGESQARFVLRCIDSTAPR